jgi:Tfp pilus assembly ATPase PilU
LQSLSASLLGIINQWLIPKKNSNAYALAVDLLINNKQQFSRILGDMEKIQALLNDREDGLSLSLGDSLSKLINDGVIEVSDAGKVAEGNAILYNKVRKVQKTL